MKVMHVKEMTEKLTLFVHYTSCIFEIKFKLNGKLQKLFFNLP